MKGVEKQRGANQFRGQTKRGQEWSYRHTIIKKASGRRKCNFEKKKGVGRATVGTKGDLTGQAYR